MFRAAFMITLYYDDGPEPYPTMNIFKALRLA
jgi:hypothetical protein